MAKTVAFVSEKGGVGKTTACYHIAVELAASHKKSVLVVDADYQRGGITGRFFPDLIERFGSGEMEGTTLFHKFQQLYSGTPLTADIDVRRWSHAWRCSLDVIIADPRLSHVSVDRLPSTNNIKANNLALLTHLQVVRSVLHSLEDDYDYILIDSHPEVSDVLRAVMYASDYCVSPVKLDRQSSIGVATIVAEMNNVNDDVEMIRAGIDVSLPYTNTIFAGSIGMMTREWGSRLKRTERLEYNRLRQTGPIFDTWVTEGDGLRRAAAQRCPVSDISGTNADKQASQIVKLTEEFLAKCPE